MYVWGVMRRNKQATKGIKRPVNARKTRHRRGRHGGAFRSAFKKAAKGVIDQGFKTPEEASKTMYELYEKALKTHKEQEEIANSGYGSQRPVIRYRVSPGPFKPSDDFDDEEFGFEPHHLPHVSPSSPFEESLSRGATPVTPLHFRHNIPRHVAPTPTPTIMIPPTSMPSPIREIGIDDLNDEIQGLVLNDDGSNINTMTTPSRRTPMSATSLKHVPSAMLYKVTPEKSAVRNTIKKAQGLRSPGRSVLRSPAAFKSPVSKTRRRHSEDSLRGERLIF